MIAGRCEQMNRSIRNLTRYRVIGRGMAALVIFFLSGGCAGDTGPSGPDLTTVASIVVSPASATVDNGFTRLFTAIVSDGAGDPVSASVIWSVDDADVGSIEQNGRFTAGVTPGLDGWVIATVGAISDSASVTVAEADILFGTHLLPTFQSSCGQSGCHGGSGGLQLDSYSNLMAGNSNNGPVVTPGDPANSYIIRKLLGEAPGSKMPLSGSVPQSWFNQLWIWIAQSAPDNRGE